VGDHPLHPAVRHHLEAMTGPLGIWQHALGTEPDRTYGVCTDDVARALLVDLRHAKVLGWQAVAADAWRSLRFLGDAFDPAWRRFRNYRGEDGAWARTRPAEDTQGRAMLALAEAVAVADDPAYAARARELLALALPGMRSLRALRAIASAALACVVALDGLGAADPLRREVERELEPLHGLLRWAFATPLGPRRDPAWPWPEPVLTYENALVPRALIVVGGHRGDRQLVLQGLRTLDWLLATQVGPGGVFEPVGNLGWWPQGGARARFEQQPIEAAATIVACAAAVGSTGDRRYRDAAESAYGWFLGANTIGVAVAEPATGGCHDGLGPDRVNRNQGAESTLAWLISLETIRALRHETRRGADPDRTHIRPPGPQPAPELAMTLEPA
jgi:hypothetical protein